MSYTNAQVHACHVDAPTRDSLIPASPLYGHKCTSTLPCAWAYKPTQLDALGHEYTLLIDLQKFA